MDMDMDMDMDIHGHGHGHMDTLTGPLRVELDGELRAAEAAEARAQMRADVAAEAERSRGGCASPACADRRGLRVSGRLADGWCFT